MIALFDATEDLTHDAEAKPGASQSQSQSQRALIVNLEARRDQAAEVITHSTSQIAHLDDKQPASVLLRPEESSVLIAEGERVMREKVSEFEKILESCTLVDATQGTGLIAIAIENRFEICRVDCEAEMMCVSFSGASYIGDGRVVFAASCASVICGCGVHRIPDSQTACVSDWYGSD